MTCLETMPKLLCGSVHKGNNFESQEGEVPAINRSLTSFLHFSFFPLSLLIPLISFWIPLLVSFT
ncbi:hypothetical protein BDV26DRAFT_134925 [Aspergillus bertholletiae]|uniref:Uncharacterized protein n=1 Tax=Aspergillus bertholletiae TaxID=1226010 RepID=A0A5N7AN17_9EURO|nr:hypothetical protein BDV26DRAFT_134925 [Aspergillus bertholletiae]